MSTVVVVGTRLSEIEQTIEDQMREAGQSLIYIGEMLIEAKEMLGHGRWLAWLHDQTESKRWTLSERTAQYLMAVNKAFSDKVMPFESFTRTALYILANADSVAVDKALLLANQGETVDKATAEILTKASPTIQDRFINRELTKEQASKLAVAVRHVSDPEVKELIETRVVHADVVKPLVQMAQADPDSFAVIKSSGFLQGSNVIPLNELTSRDLQHHHEETKREAVLQRIAESEEIVLLEAKVVVSAMVVNGFMTIKLPKDAPEIGQGEILYMTLKRKV